MAGTATVYRRFEREKICGKTYPWSEVTKETEVLITDKVLSYKESNIENKKEEENIYEAVTKRRRSNVSQISEQEPTRLNSDLIQFSPRTTVVTSPPYYDQYDSDISSDYLPPKQRKDSLLSSGFDSDSEYARPVSIIDKAAPRRRDTEYTIEKVNITPLPAMYAPRPGSIAVWAEKLMENAEAFPTWISAPTRRKYYDEVVKDEPDIPRRVPRSYMRGLEPQDATAALVHFLAWYGFFVGRLLSIACFINYFPVLAIVLLFSHYQVMLLFLIVPQASTLRRCFYIFLAFIYLFCLMEFKIRFRHVRVWHVFWIIVCTIEAVVFTGLWASTSSGIDDWWKIYVVKVIMISLVLSYVCFTFYFVLLKPRETIVYVKNKNELNKYLPSTLYYTIHRSPLFFYRKLFIPLITR